jgi:hypothetical protein
MPTPKYRGWASLYRLECPSGNSELADTVGRCSAGRNRSEVVARIAGVNIPTNKRVVIALQYIHGIGQKNAKDIMARSTSRWSVGCRS